MKRIILLLVFLFIGIISYAQKDKNSNQGKPQDTKITPGASGVKRSIGYRFSSITEVGDPGDGVFRYNNKNISSVTYLIVDKNDIKGEDQTKWYRTWDDTTGATGRGRLTLVELKGENVNVFDVTDVFIDGNGYWKFPVKYVSGKLPENDSVYFYVFERIAHSGGQGRDKQGKEVAEEAEEVIEAAIVEVVEEAEVVEEVEEVEAVEEVEEAPVAEMVKEAEEVVEAAIVEVVEKVEEVEEVEEAEVVEEVEAVEEVEEVPAVVVAEAAAEVSVVEVVEEAAEVVEAAAVEEAPVIVIAEAPVEVVEEPVAEAAPAVVVAEVPAAIEEAPPIAVTEAPAEVVKEPVTKPQQVTKITPVDRETKPIIQQGETTKEAPVTPETVTKPVTQPVQERVTKPVIKPDREPIGTRTEPAKQPAQGTQTTTGQGRRTVSTTKPSTETKTNTVSQEPRNVPATQPVQQAQTTVGAGKRTIPTTQPAPIPERKPLPEPEQGPPVQIALQPVQETQKEPVTQPASEKKYDDFPVVQNYYESSGDRSHGKCYRGIIEIGYALKVSEYGMNNFRFNFINGFNIRNTSIGLGIGVRKYFDKPANHPDWHLVSSNVQMPVFLDIRTRFSSKTFTPYLGIGIGSSQGFDSDTTNNKPEGLYFHATGGIWFNISDRFALFGGFAYEMQKLEYANFSDEIPYKKNTNSISINVGIAF